MRKFVIFISLILLAMLAGLFYWAWDVTVPVSDVPEVSYEEVTSGERQEAGGEGQATSDEGQEVDEVGVKYLEPTQIAVDETNENSDPDLPSEINLAVPFTPQAPFANWDLPYQEACEEASAYMVYLYFQGEGSGLVDAQTADNEIWNLVNFETDYLGTYLDTTALQTVDFIDAYYGLSATMIEDPTIEQIKAELAAGRPVIVPAAGQKLGNPFFSGVGPLYHMLVLRGYDGDTFITNDPGTRNGEGYVYDVNVIMEAMGDWNNGDPANGAKRVIFVAPSEDDR
ncbi:hypothetical protein CO057_02775 [Candidatus Uhrbacteria bacterium CG_4_9_14_0_2_um_filter_41_50]|uniref:Peptidase C39-like domain-containing protein n=1 Tax=Candidatus Uhrbacteria bacterium CG_4_9_14_0_2_um_filter_41_50 TaxID=1975031 RepID=A0A2M8ENY3_9BACT|nr:MAG: hypothetical protein COZ45_02640 [Candidatus Uhrbacteria bacterium CG_4_10_14_3_um_filter_41_21]PIZ54565.1 MAG: hypothetical protein COY24_03290 [Candidatus Uhrbacteria bacterium CG_4_10_14_0_2_um_filter_41_21]PJB84492.1 MAG: hypothetical protein CO086_03295 [Candidatus Uhrbacteria bacterium CG_4_9_14_0_8_um_filter_41_16]PJC24440.1 MAG: hypothetical protein CO057_02775 [Candidatus Uhrbacteria bacterium CG_4_9_14_0_2_um_filter_41_50]PJE75093.1 MAG: hypothetical protein COV03_01915 [Candi